MWDHSEYLVVGFVARPHGVRGELRVGLYNADSTALDEAERVYLVASPRDARGTLDGAAAPVAYEVEAVRDVNEGLLLCLVGVDGRDAADALRGRQILVKRADLPPLAADEVYLTDLVGCVVVTQDGRELGRVADVLEAGPHDTLVIHDDRVERLLPYVPNFVLSVDLAAHRIVVDPPEGLPEEPLRQRG
ncbi:MAG TPA: ribosome maturation factor RimM [Polyangia bacterium]|jgi:16S rRNA processing protein RimM